MKKSLQEALKQAQKQSLDFPQLTVRVLDKKGRHACVNVSDWVYREKVRDGWEAVAAFRNGVRLIPFWPPFWAD